MKKMMSYSFVFAVGAVSLMAVSLLGCSDDIQVITSGEAAPAKPAPITLEYLPWVEVFKNNDSGDTFSVNASTLSVQGNTVEMWVRQTLKEPKAVNDKQKVAKLFFLHKGDCATMKFSSPSVLIPMTDKGLMSEPQTTDETQMTTTFPYNMPHNALMFSCSLAQAGDKRKAKISAWEAFYKNKPDIKN